MNYHWWHGNLPSDDSDYGDYCDDEEILNLYFYLLLEILHKHRNLRELDLKNSMFTDNQTEELLRNITEAKMF